MVVFSEHPHQSARRENNAEVSAFYQAITDWVKENHSEYVTSYGNNDYYYGGSAYQNNFDFRVSAWQGQGTYDGMSSDEITALMWSVCPNPSRMHWKSFMLMLHQPIMV